MKTIGTGGSCASGRLTKPSTAIVKAGDMAEVVNGATIPLEAGSNTVSYGYNF